MLVRTDKVKRIIEFVDTMGVCDSNQIAAVFFGHQKKALFYTQQKLKQLYNYKLIKRKKTFLGTRYIYYYKNFPQQLEHRYLLTELYTKICEKYGFRNCTCKCEYTGIEGIRPDAYITIKHDGYKYLFFVEVHISNNDFNYDKYREVYSKKSHIRLTQDSRIFPYVLVVTDEKILHDPHIDFMKIDTKFTEFDKVMSKIIE